MRLLVYARANAVRTDAEGNFLKKGVKIELKSGRRITGMKEFEH